MGNNLLGVWWPIETLATLMSTSCLFGCCTATAGMKTLETCFTGCLGGGVGAMDAGRRTIVPLEMRGHTFHSSFNLELSRQLLSTEHHRSHCTCTPFLIRSIQIVSSFVRAEQITAEDGGD